MNPSQHEPGPLQPKQEPIIVSPTATPSTVGHAPLPDNFAPITTEKKSIIVSPTATPSAVSYVPLPDHFAPVTAELVLSTLKDKGLTDLQKQKFMSTYRTRIVRWHVVVLDVKEGFSSNMILVFRPAADKSSLPDILTATFSATHENDLLNLKKGQPIVIDGALEFITTGVGPSPSLREARLVQVSG